MKNASFIRAAGMAGMFGAVLWLVSLFIEYGFGLFPPGEGVLFVTNQAMFFVAQLCYLAVIFGLMQARAAGSGLFGRISLGLFALGWAALAAALMLSLISDDPVADVLILIGAIASTLGGLLAGIAVAVARRLGGWRNFAPLIQGSYQLLVNFLPVVIANREPTQLTESLWAGTWFLVGLALFASARNAKAQEPPAEMETARTNPGRS